MIYCGQYVVQTILCPSCGVATHQSEPTTGPSVSVTCINPDCPDTGAVLVVDRRSSFVLWTDAKYIGSVRVFPALYDGNGNQVWPAPKV